MCVCMCVCVGGGVLRNQYCFSMVSHNLVLVLVYFERVV